MKCHITEAGEKKLISGNVVGSVSTSELKFGSGSASKWYESGILLLI
jgi:hypothetical protein